MRHAFSGGLRHQVYFCTTFHRYFTSQKSLLHARHIRSCVKTVQLLECRTVPWLAKRHMCEFEIERERLKSFVKDLYVAHIDMSWIFPFPTLENSREVNSFKESIKPIENFFADRKINSAKLDDEAEIPAELIRELKDIRLFGLVIPQNYGGMGLSNLKLAKVLEEISTADNSVNMMVATHNLLGAQPIINYGSDEQKEKYLPKLASGDMIAAFCCNETSAGSDISMMKTTAKMSEDGKHWLLSGEKTSINNGGIADLMIVFAKIQVNDVDDEVNDTIGAFIVERSFGGICNGPQEDKMGMRALNTSDVTFDEAPVPLENMIGEEKDGFKIATDTLHDARLGLACGIIGPMRKIVQDATNYADHRVQFGQRIKDFKLVKEKVFLMAEDIYAMESVAYLTMGKYDQAVEEEKIPELSVESAIAKVFLAQKASAVANNCIDLFGHRAYTKSLPFERILRDTKMLSLSEGTTDVLKLYIALSCFKHTESVIENKMRIGRQGSMGLKFRIFLDKIRDRYGAGNIREGLFRKRIPSFGVTHEAATRSWLDERVDESGEHCEEIVLGLYRKVYAHIKYFKSNLQDEQQRLRRFADLTILLYSMIAVLARCNKSLIMGVRDSDRDYLIATAYIERKFRECHLMLDEIQSDFGRSLDQQVVRIGKELLEEQYYAIPHPLALDSKCAENPTDKT